MKRRTVHIMLLVMFSAISWAQPRLKVPEMYIGVQGGLMIATTYFSPTVPGTETFIKTLTYSGDGGFVFRYLGHKYCGLQIELNYMQRGWRERGNEKLNAMEIPFDYQRTLHYIELPLLMHLYFGNTTWRFTIDVGPQIGYCLYDNKGKGIQQSLHIEQYDPIAHPFDWGISGGVGVECNTKNAGLYHLSTRFNYSFSTCYSNDASSYFSKSNAMGLSVNLAWMWPIHKKGIRTQKIQD